MDKETIVDLLEEKHKILFNFFERQDLDQWESGPDGKWTSGQQAYHLLQSIKTLNNAMSLPKFVIKFKFGKANRDCRDYDAIVNRYKVRLSQNKGVEFRPSKNMKIPKLKDRDYIIARLETENKKLQYKTKKWSDNALNNLILPHPLMGKMPVREVVMWTAYHTEHHTKQLQENY